MRALRVGQRTLDATGLAQAERCKGNDEMNSAHDVSCRKMKGHSCVAAGNPNRRHKEGRIVDETQFNALAEAELVHIEAAVEALDLDLDIELKPGGILELTFEEDGAKVIVNRHAAAREIWLASRSGGFHFQPQADGGWFAAREQRDLYAALAQVLSEHAGEDVVVPAPQR